VLAALFPLDTHPEQRPRSTSKLSEPYSVVRLDEVEAVPTFGKLKWKPLRRPLDVRAFGVNAYWAAESGDELIEQHDELGAGAGKHEELYVVIGGSARFSVAGDEVDAPPGTVVFVRDPAAKRGAVATAANTTALAVGGVRGEPYSVAPWESVAHAIPSWERGDYAEAKAMIAAGVERHPDNPSLLYNLACVEALSGEAEPALDHLRRALEFKPSLAEEASSDEDFASIRDLPGFPA